MISAGISTKTRREVYRRDGYRCALCDSTKYLQIHHYAHRSIGGSNDPMNLITLCMTCHAAAHGTYLDGYPLTKDDVEQAAAEYLADYYAPKWYPWEP